MSPSFHLPGAEEAEKVLSILLQDQWARGRAFLAQPHNGDLGGKKTEPCRQGSGKPWTSADRWLWLSESPCSHPCGVSANSSLCGYCLCAAWQSISQMRVLTREPCTEEPRLGLLLNPIDLA